jgi:CRISPR/Cas system-associated exonuclease Cas4 (RecB family)
MANKTAKRSLPLTKTLFNTGLTCPKLLWCEFNAPEMIPEISEALQAIFDQGHEVGDLAKTLYPEGVEIEYGRDSVKKTQELLKKRLPIFEASFAYKDAYCKTDILVPVGKDEWDLIEVKSSTKIKDEHIPDVAFQQYCLEGSKVKIRRCHLMYINNEYVRKGKIEAKKLLEVEDITKQVADYLPNVETEIKRLVDIINGPMPDAKLGTECIKPKECPVHCEDLPELAELTYGGARVYELINQGIKLFKDMPADFKLNDRQKIQKEAAITGKRHIEPDQIHRFLKEIKYPLYFLDFETISPAIPLFDGTRPYQNIPFQFSLHIIEKPGAKPKHLEFLVDNPEDPRPAVVETLRNIESKGTVLAYNASFEKGVIEDLIEAFPKEKHLDSVLGRLVDLMVPFKNFWYYDPAQRGSASLKEVLPALTGKSYANLEVSEGSEAARKFLDMTYKNKPMSPGEKLALRKALLIYCKQDTEAMIDILKVLEKI